MNCANHPDRERTAFCQNCGKPLCNECVRNVGASVFCEPCLTARVAGTAPGSAYGAPPPGYSGPGAYSPAGPPASSVPNPMMAGLLGLIPGVGAMYNEQYAKGIVHLMVFALLVSLSSEYGLFGLFVGGWVIYMAIEAYHTARARRDGTPLPNPFGLNDLSERLGFGRAWPGAGPVAGPGPTAPPVAGAAPNVPPANPYAPPYSYPYTPPVASWAAPPAANPYAVPPVPPVPPVPEFDPNLPVHRRFPSGAIWLIGLGVFFLLANTSFFGVLHARVVMPFLLIGFGVWLFVRKMTSDGLSIENDGTPLYHWRLSRAISGAMWVVLTGVIWLLASLHILSWGRSWPIYIIAAGLMMFLKRTIEPGYGYGYPPPPVTPPPPASAASQATGLVPSDSHLPSASNDQEGR
jgi:hypothetical protein